MPPEVAGPGDQDPLETDAGAPPALEQFANGLARKIREEHVEDEEHAPDELRHFVGAPGLVGVADVIGLHVQGRTHAEDDRKDAADQDREEVVDPRSPTPQPIDALKLKPHRRQDGDERKHVQVLIEWRIAFRDRDQSAFEPDGVREHERPAGQQRVGGNVERDEQTVVASYHAVPSGAASVWSMARRMASR